MNKNFPAVLGLAAALAAGPAGAGYFGIALGQNTIKDWDDVETALDDGSFTSSSSDDSDTGFRIFGGFGGNDTVSFEIGYSDFGEATFDAQSDGCCFYPAGPVSASATSSGLDFGVVARAPMSDTFDVMGRIGILVWDVEVDADVSGSSGSDSESGNDIFFGIGAEFAVAPSIALRGEFTRYSLDDSDLDSLSLSVVFRGMGAQP